MPDLRNTSLSHTAATTFQTCNRKYQYGYEWGLERKERKGNRQRGIAFALGLEHWNEGAIHEFYDSVLATADRNGVDAITQERDVVVLLAKGYMRKYEKPALTEVPFTSIIPGPDGEASPFWNRGYLDAVDIRDGKHIVVENKLFSMWMHANELALAIDPQVTRYLDAARNILGWDTPHVEYRVTKWPTIRLTKKETWDEYLGRVQEGIDLDLSEGTGKHYLSFKCFRTDNQLQDFRESLGQLTKLVQYQHRQRFFPVNPGHACAMYGGCDFLPLCTDQPEAAELYQVKQSRKKGENK